MSAGPARAAWTVREAVLVLVAVVVAGPLLVALIEAGIVHSPGSDGALWFWLVATVAYYGAPALLMLVFARHKREGTFAAMGFRPMGPRRVAARAVPAFLLALAVTTVYSYVAAELGFSRPESSTRVMEELVSSFGEGAGQVIVLALLLVVVAPVVEEAIFRGVALSGLAGRIGDAGALAVTSVLFGVVHMDLWQAVPLVLLGAILGVLALRTKSIWPSVVTHAMVNGFSYAVAYSLHLSGGG